MRRSWLEIYFNVLKAIHEGANSPTHICYKSNLPWKVLQDVIKNLKAMELIREEQTDEKRRYYITPKGQEALTSLEYAFRQFEDIIASRERSVETKILMTK